MKKLTGQEMDTLISSNAASNANPPKSYGSLDKAFAVMRYRNARLDYHAKSIGDGLYTQEVIKMAQEDVVVKYGEPV